MNSRSTGWAVGRLLALAALFGVWPFRNTQAQGPAAPEVELTPQQRARLDDAAAMNASVVSHYQNGRHAEAISLAEEAASAA